MLVFLTAHPGDALAPGVEARRRLIGRGGGLERFGVAGHSAEDLRDEGGDEEQKHAKQAKTAPQGQLDQPALPLGRGWV